MPVRHAIHNPVLSLPPFIHESARLDDAPPALMDRLWAEGWRHFGADFFRYSVMADEEGNLLTIQPLRLRTRLFRPNKHQRRVVARNADASIRVVPARVDDERQELFLRHRTRFSSNIPESLRDFLPSPEPDRRPCECVSMEVRIGSRLAAVSYLDVGGDAVSSVYAMFDPEESRRALGTLTLLEEIRWAETQGKTWLYPGYATEQPSIYDYKKSFRPLESFDWRGNWKPLEPAARSRA